MPGIRPPLSKEQVLARIDENTYKDPNSGCWIWMNSLLPTGYAPAHFTKYKEYVTAHRLSYFLYRGEIPNGFVLDHLCRVRCCCNPWHMEVVTQLENMRRGVYPKETHRNARKTHCKRGHPFNEENTFYQGNTRQCRTCVNTKNNKAYYKRKVMR